MGTKHTPGPWRIAKRGASVLEVVNAHGGRIAELPNSSEATAKLIAAAPDLLEAARRALDAYDAGYLVDGQIIDTAATEMLRAAIAKATS